MPETFTPTPAPTPEEGGEVRILFICMLTIHEDCLLYLYFQLIYHHPSLGHTCRLLGMRLHL